MGSGDKKLSKYLTWIFRAHGNAMIYQQVTLSGDAEWPKVADAVIEAQDYCTFLATTHATSAGISAPNLHRFKTLYNMLIKIFLSCCILMGPHLNPIDV